ncbi:MAG: hypothetical protein Q9227_000020 [Pyrenula ochraceoflavens]
MRASPAVYERHAQMDDMGGMDMGSMGSMSMGDGVPSLFAIQKYYWAAVGSAIALAFVMNLSNIALRRQRLSCGSAKPRSLFWTAHATSTAICREITSAPLGTIQIKSYRLPLPPLGRVILVLSNLITIIVLCFYKLNTADQWSWEDVGYRTGFVAICQLPLVFLLAGKENIIGLLTGLSYERLNWLHRWVARTLWLNVTIHMGFWFRSWARYDYITSKLSTDPITQRGFAAWCILTFIVATSWMPIRRWNYELFVIVHLVTFAGFIGAVWIHVPEEVKVWVWIPIGLFFFDRLFRATKVLWANITLFHFRKRKNGDIQPGLWANSASLTHMPGGLTRISISKPAISWKPGQHAFLACHSLVPLQSHPFTIASLPSDGKMEFFVKAERGGTRRFLRYAQKHSRLLTPSENETCRKHVSIEGPYGRMRPLDQFDSVVLFAGSTGATFTVPLMRDIVWKWTNTLKADKVRQSKPVTRRIKFVWVIKELAHLEWFNKELTRARQDVQALKVSDPAIDIDLESSIYITCDEKLLEKSAEKRGGNLHGSPEEVSEEKQKEFDKETEKRKSGYVEEVRSTTSDSTSEEINGGGCQPGGTCCCKSTVEDESEPHVCTCGHPGTSATPAPVSEPTASSVSNSSKKQNSVQTVKVLSGRPAVTKIVRRVLEEADGETAVVGCGPKGLRDDVRNTCVRLSDERAVHKGTGAMGIYCHIEGFGY